MTGRDNDDEMAEDPRGSFAAARNDLSATVVGPSVQTHDVYGGVHVHQHGTPAPVPDQLPPGPRLINRAQELAAFDRTLSEHPRPGAAGVVVVSGAAGIGKSALALHWAHANRDEFPDGALYADLCGHAPGAPAAPGAVLGGFLRSLGASPERVPAALAERAALYRSLTARSRIVVVLDDALSAAQVRPLLPAATTSLTVVTSRWRMSGLLAQGARGLQLPHLDPEAALELLGQMLGAERVAAEPDTARELVRLCAHVPLAVCVAGARLAARPRWPLDEMVDSLRQERRRLAALSTDDEVAMQAALDLSYQALPGEPARLYRLLGLLPGASFDSRVAAAVAAIPRRQAREWLDVLADANLVEDVARDRYRLHELVRLHARGRVEQQETEEERDAAARRVLDCYLHTADRADGCVRPYRHRPPYDVARVPDDPPGFDSREDALRWLADEFGNLLTALRWAFDREQWVTAWQLAGALWPAFLYQGHHDERLECDDLGLRAARNCGDSRAEARMLNRIGLALRDRGRFDEADESFRGALDLWRHLDDPFRVAESSRQLGLVAAERQHLAEATSYFSDARHLYRKLGESRNVGLALADLGRVCTTDGRSGEALGYLRQAEQILRDAHDPYSHARTVIELGRAHLDGADPDAAAAHLHDALRALRELGSPHGQADALEQLGRLAERAGRPEEARQRYVEAIEILANPATPRSARLQGHLDRLAARGL